MNESRPLRVCIFVRNNFTVDARVIKQARSIAAAGHETLVLAVHSPGLPEAESRDGFQVRRISPALTWADAFPRLHRIARGREIAVTSEPSTSKPQLADPRAPREAPSPRDLLTWALFGRGRPPRSWSEGSGSAGRRMSFALKLLARVPAQRTRRGVRVVSREARRRRIRMERRVLRPTRFRQVDRRMAREGISFRPDVCWANDADTLRPSSATAKAAAATLIYDAHEVIWDDISLKRSWRLRWSLVERTHIRRVARCTTVCDPIADLMASRYRIQRPTVILNCPPLAETRHAPSRDESPLAAHRRQGERIVLFHGSISRWRGIEELILAIKLSAPHIRLVVLGHGAHRVALEQLAEREGVAERVTFLPSVPAGELAPWLVGADLGTIPYLRIGQNHEYSTPNKLFEYMHYGIPVVANELPQVSRIVREVGFGLICDCSDPTVLAQTIADVIDDDRRLHEMSERARKGAPRYSWEREARKVLAVVSGQLADESAPNGEDHQNV